jgi:UDP-N-acetylmuramoylalanine--D-glutamate ligase
VFYKYFSSLRGKTVGVVGLGVSNRPLAECLAAHGARVTVYDRDETIDPRPWQEKGISLVLGEHYLDSLRGEVVFRTPGLRPDHGALMRVRADGGEVSSEMEVFFALCPAKTIAVTGSDGKTTTSALIAEMLRAETESSGTRVFLGGNIGAPLLASVPEMTENDFAVVELSSFQLISMTQSPYAAVVTNITPNHLDWHTGMDEYVAAKQRILDFQHKDGLAVLNADSALAAAMRTRGRRAMFGWDTLTDGKIGGFLKPEDILMPGRHNAENVMAAVAVTAEWVKPETAERVARTFPGVAHRNMFVRELDGVAYYNDSIGSSPARTVAGIMSHTRPIVLICGGYDKNLSYEPLARALPGRVKAVVLMGATAGKIRAAAEKVPGCPPLHGAICLEEAVQMARALAKPGDAVLLSPASASFDMFKNFEERGDAFMRAVNDL